VSDCLFCRIVAGEIPATVVRSGERTVAFRDVNPQAPTHVLVVPREHHADAGALAAADPELAGVLLAEAALARHTIGLPTEDPLDADGRYDPATGAEPGRRPLRLAVLGDSGAAGLGVDAADQTPGAVVAQLLADGSHRCVELTSFAVVGAQTGSLDAQIDRALPVRPDVVIIVVGANDVTHRVTPAASVRMLALAVRRLRAADVEVVVGTCPDLGTVQPIPHPLKWVARQWSRSLAAAQTVATVEAGGRSVALADLLGAEFERQPETFFGPDQFHPSATGYRALAQAMAPSVLASLGYGDVPREPSYAPVPTIAVEDAAAAASDRAGTEVVAAADGLESEPADRAGTRSRTRWAVVRLPGRPRLRRATRPSDHDTEPVDGSSDDPAQSA
jgi:lysophospholipase L1-like esterase